MTPKLGNADLRFLCTAPLLNKIYLQSLELIFLLVWELRPGQEIRNRPTDQ